MPISRRQASCFTPTAALVAVVLSLAGALTQVCGDTVVMNNGVVYRGMVDRDKPMLWVYDGLKRVALRDSKVRRIESDASFRNLEVFKLEQPLVVHSGSMPKEVIRVEAASWNDRGRRTFSYEGSRLGRFVKMEQAIIEMGPYLVKIRGVDGFWQGQLATSQVPREVILGILAKVDQKDKNERIRVARFLIQAEWFSESRAELDRIGRDFPDDADLKERITAARASVMQLEAVQTRAAIDRCKLSQQPREATALLKGFPTKDIAADLESQVRELQRTDDNQSEADRTLADELKGLASSLSKETQAEWNSSVRETLKALKEAPDAVRDRFVAWQKARLEGKKLADEALFALAMSGYVVGADAAVDDLKTARMLWTARNDVRNYLAMRDAEGRIELLDQIEKTFDQPTDPAHPRTLNKLDLVSRMVVRMTPPLYKEDAEKPNPGKTKIHRVADDENADPTEYAVTLPPEYHPLRSYPTIVALHDGQGVESAIAWWSAEAARHGYIVIAPEYMLPGQEKTYRYTTSEHAAVELALRDARRRYAIDSDRVFVGGQLEGGNMAWDFGLAHPDLFAGVVVISGLPAKYVTRYHANLDRERGSLYVVLGELAPAANEIIFGGILKPLIAKALDVTYLEYHRRGLESLPEEAPAVFEWMDRRHRETYPKKFEAVTARLSDNRFFGVVIHEFQPGRTMAPEAVDPFGKNLNPATIKMTSSSLSNNLRLETNGVKRLDVWVSPKLIDFNKKFEVRINNRTFFKGLAKPDLGPLLEDLRIRGDRQQLYWLKISAG